MKKGAKLIAPFILMTENYFFVLKYGRSVSSVSEIASWQQFLIQVILRLFSSISPSFNLESGS
jgi:hypothetical protein